MLSCHICMNTLIHAGPSRTKVVRSSTPQEAQMRPAPSAALTASLMLLGCTGDHLFEPTGLPGELARAGAGKEVAAPSALSATAISENRIDLVWADNSTNETNLELFRSTAGQTGPFALWTTLSANTTTYSDRSAQPGTEFCYRIRAVRRTGAMTTYSAFSNTACATTSVPIPPPPRYVEGLRVVPFSSTGVWMTWGNQSAGIGYRIERSVDGGATWSTVGTADYHATFSDSGLTSDQQVCYRIIAFNLGGDAPPSQPDCTAPPIAPSNLVGSLREDGAVELIWSDNSAVEDGYEVWALITTYDNDCESGCFDSTDAYLMGAVPANGTTFVCQYCAGSPTYVIAIKDGGMSNGSNAVVVPNGP
jgi:hypothetical protein